MPLSTTVRSKPRIFYGWYVLAMIMVSGFVGAGTGQVFFGLMMKPITEDLGWSRSAVAASVTVGALVGAFAQPIAGYLADRHGPRVIVSLGLVVLAVAYVLLSSMAEVWHIFMGYALARGVSQGALTGVVARTAAVNWFRRMRGRALGFTSMAPALGSGLVVLAGQGLLSAGVGWRMVFVILAVVSLSLFVPAALVLRRRPEDMGLLPDGDDAPASADAGQRSGGAVERSWTLGEARRTRTLWLITYAMAAGAMSNGAVTFQMVVYYSEQGLSDGVAGIALSAYSFSGAAAAVTWGFLTERFSERKLAFAAFAAGGIVTLGFAWVTAAAVGIVLAALFGLTVRGEGSLLNLMLASYFGRGSFGTISGFVSPFQFAGLGLGPLLGALLIQATGSFDALFIVACGLFFSAALAILIAKRPMPAARLDAVAP